MCRISGIINPDSLGITRETFLDLNASMHHGGPDDNEVLFFDNAWMGHNRLSIIDLSDTSHQPMQIDNLVLTYNGEIYNFRELRRELEIKGHRFVSTGDSEVIIRSYIEWGAECFEKFNGMFSFGLLDKTQNKFYLVRDASGIKPLYYSIKNNSLIFSSEMRAFYHAGLFEEDENWKIYFLAFGHLPAPVTTLKNVKVFPKGNYLEWNLVTSEYSLKQYLTYSFKSMDLTLEESVDLVREKLNAAVERHLISDASIGVFLSGGIDSSLLTLIASQTQKNNLKTLSVYFDEDEYSEFYFQKIIADQVQGNHISVKIDSGLFYNKIDDIFSAMDQPTTDGVNSYFISSVAHDYGLKTVLSGIGADELFGGYPSFSRINWINNLRLIPSFALSAFTVNSNKFKRINYLKDKSIVNDYLFLRGFFSFDEIADILDVEAMEIREKLMIISGEGEEYSIENGNKASWLESNFYMHNQLLKDTDMMSMWHSLETRVPFLDKELVELVYSIPADVKFNSVPKHLLIKAYKEILPEEIYKRPKKGFTFPFQQWLTQSSKVEELSQTNLVIKKYFQTFKQGKLHWSRMWALYVSECWSQYKNVTVAG